MVITRETSARVDAERMNAFEEALYRLGKEYGFSIERFHVSEDRIPADRLPEIEMTWMQLPKKKDD